MQRGPAREALNIALSHFLAHLAAANKTSISPRQQASFLHMPLTVPSPAQIMTVSIFCGYRLLRSGRASSGSTARAAISNSPCCRDAISAPSSIAAALPLALLLTRMARFTPSSTRHLLISCTMRASRFITKTRDLVFFIGFKVTFKPLDMAVALKCEDMSR